ncbi:hypothetical protein DRB96_32105 [Streptomyces sp. ICC1]|nr:hypothetical protein DRB89_30810 [Streptomyces sp. ICC4]AWZ16119.1 hypothetical protein DRB96_32105 [Streptomyces sp. ICC1]
MGYSVTEHSACGYAGRQPAPAIRDPRRGARRAPGTARVVSMPGDTMMPVAMAVAMRSLGYGVSGIGPRQRRLRRPPPAAGRLPDQPGPRPRPPGRPPRPHARPARYGG